MGHNETQVWLVASIKLPLTLMRVMNFNNLNSERIMKTIADLRKEFKQQHKIDAQQFTRHANERTYSLDYVHWLEDMVLSQANGQSTGERQLTIPDVSGLACNCIGMTEVHQINDKFLCGTCGKPLRQACR